MKAPAPWTLRGRAFICALKLPPAQRTDEAGTPESLSEPGGSLSYVMFVDYSASDVGPYHEILFIPGNYRFADGRRHPSIGRIYVSSQESVDNGRANWGIPKDRADFQVEKHGKGEKVTVTRDGEVIAKLVLKQPGPSLPFPGGLSPAKFRTLGQHRDGKTFLYAPKASGWLGYAVLEEAWGNGTDFPALQHGKNVFAASLKDFKMNFPVAEILDRI
jgi:hypothetical protein